ncbi:MAG: hypothetical protein CVU11_10670 [Bacteroidetes bacterium HGW-Bacteroidetes-6]|jgi:hypothetical protein|nr:MAG: hypothetical protein CVU11_10670 [Bacteroidetes bacterium HGW-Bacteroidetes-6]
MRQFLLFVAAFLLVFGVHAQSNFLNLQGGAGIGWISGNDYSSENQRMRSVPAIGFEYAGFLNDGAFVTIGVDFIKKGAWDLGIKYVESSDTISTNSYTSDFKYLVIPMMVHKVVGTDNVMLTLGGGFFLGALLQHQHEINTGILNIRSITNDTEDYNMFDFGLQLRIGFRVMINEGYYFILNANHQMGLLNTYSKTLVGGGGLKTNASFVLAGFGFKL